MDDDTSKNPPAVEDTQKQEEYALLKDDFEQIINRCLDGFQEKIPGREINSIIMRLKGQYGLVVQTNKRGLIEVPEMTGIEIDNQGRKKKQRMIMGMNCSTTTNKTTFGSVNLLRPGETTIKEFQTNAGAHELLKLVVEASQKRGEELQRKIDEDETEHWDRIKVETKHVASRNWDVEQQPNTDQVFGLVTLARQTLKSELGAKLKDCKMVFFSIANTMEISSSDGTKVDLTIPRTGFTIEAQTTKGNKVFDSIRGTGRMSALTRFDKDKTPEQVIEDLAKRVAKRCVDIDRAQPCSVLGGEAHVIMDGEVVGVLAHEVYGHTSEADIVIANRRDKDVDLNLKARLGGQVSENPSFSIIDDGNFSVQLGKVKVDHCYGAVIVDEEGIAGTRTELVKDGIQSLLLNSADTFSEIAHGLPDNTKNGIIKVGLTGNLRSQRFDKAPLIRMTNTFILPDDENGKESVEELAAMIPKTKKGVYLVSCAGGWVVPDTGDFQVTGQLGYLIENGVLTDKPVKDVIIHGNITKFGNKIKAIGSSETIKRTSTGWCGKNSQWVPVEDGGPAILIEDAPVGKEQPTWFFHEVYKDYSRQLQEVSTGKRKSSEIYVKLVEDATDGEVKEHSNLCVLIKAIPVDDEVKMLLGKEEVVSQYIINPDGTLEEKRNI